ncbi:hypothetical protein NQ315_004562 [Exocentrus adspersus]|uniref:G-protein coupled receptors family 2 profile 2 domain-containing protein n=1 Tax=Exocentrus adspersus TaxID=1586481 RepID=A0AAV8VNQ5_9CUCU|nr:hypothetical protein NQ315_004562 [Exocentrus adspersus]
MFSWLIPLLLVMEILIQVDGTLDLCTNNNSTDLISYSRKEKTQKCGCETNKCIRKCCKIGYSLDKTSCNKNNSSDIFKVPVYVDQNVMLGVLEVWGSLKVGVMKCPFYLVNNSDPADAYYVQANGKVWIYDEFIDNDHYCLDRGLDAMNELRLFLCFPESQILGKKQFVLSATLDYYYFFFLGMIISMPFLLATFLVYAILPESNLHRKALMNYVMSLLLAYILLVTVQLYLKAFQQTVCSAIGYLIPFFFLVSFFWMNVMCLDMWFAFSGMRGFNGRRVAERKRFFMYFGYAYGVPLLHIIVVCLINNLGDEQSIYYPGIGKEKCFLRDGLPNLLYLYGPMAILITTNIILFILTAVKIQKVKKETSMLKHSDSKRHTYEDDKQKFNLYVKLLFAMGINWTMELISWAVQWKMSEVPPYVWYLTDFCNAMYGVFIFFIFVFKKKIWQSLRRRYYVLRGKPHLAHSMSATQTRSSNYSTTETGLSDHRLSEFKNSGREERMLNRNHN